MKSGVSFAMTTPLPRRRSAKAATCVDDGRVGVRSRNDLEQMEVARRVEEVRAEEVAAEASVRPSASAPIGMPDVFDDTMVRRAEQRFDLREKRLLDVELLDDGFDHPVGGAGAGQVGVEAAGPASLRWRS